jgi:hypothetical protein
LGGRANGGHLSQLTETDLISILTGNPEAIDVHLTLVERDISIDGHKVKVHCHCLTVDGNGRVQPNDLPSSCGMQLSTTPSLARRLQMQIRDQKFNSTEAIAELVERAKRSFTDLAKTGEGGEMLLFLLAERFLQLPRFFVRWI